MIPFKVRLFRSILLPLASLGLAFGLVACSQGVSASESQPVATVEPSIISTTLAIIRSSTPTTIPTAIFDTQTPTSLPSDTPAPTSTSTSTSIPTSTPQLPATLISSPTATSVPCFENYCIYPGHFWLDSPIAPPGNTIVDRGYPYGASLEGEREIHHGVELPNPLGTPVIAAAAGTVIVAGDDHHIDFYSNWHHFYGNLVIIEHDFPELGEPLYTLYAHLSEIQTSVGATVQAGEQIGLVGSSGSALGYHLHFEVRLGDYEYNSTRNPELWLKPNLDDTGQPFGIIIGQLLDEFGDFLYIPGIVVEQLDPVGKTIETFYVETYADQFVKGDDLWGENFAIGGLPTGRYRITFVSRGMRNYEVEVLPGMVTVLYYDARDPKN